MGMIWKDNLPHCDLCGVWRDDLCDCDYGELRHRIEQLEAAIAAHKIERLPHMTNAQDRQLWSILEPQK